jgi:guanylate kinase
MKERGNLFILSGPAGAGKGTLRKILFREIPELSFSVSCTTRPPRHGEMDGRDYHFVSADDFREMINRGEFLEWADVHGNYYGTKRLDVESDLKSGRDVLLEIDVQGSRQVKSKMPEAIRVFITAGSLDELEWRLEERGSESPSQMDVRLRNAATEMRHAAEYDHIIVNDAVERSSRELINLVKGYRNGDKKLGRNVT